MNAYYFLFFFVGLENMLFVGVCALLVGKFYRRRQ